MEVIFEREYPENPLLFLEFLQQQRPLEENRRDTAYVLVLLRIITSYTLGDYSLILFVN